MVEAPASRLQQEAFARAHAERAAAFAALFSWFRPATPAARPHGAVTA